MAAADELEVKTVYGPHGDEDGSREEKRDEVGSRDVIPLDDDDDTTAEGLEVGHRDYSEGTLSKAVEKGRLISVCLSFRLSASLSSC